MESFNQYNAGESNLEKNEESSSNEALDSQWYDRFERITFEDYEYFGGDVATQKRQEADFRADLSDEPTLSNPKLDEIDLEKKDEEFLTLKKDVLSQETNPVVRQLYRWKINEMLATTRMLKASKEGDDRKFSRYCEFIYGKPSQEIFGYEMKKLKKTITEAQTSDDVGKREAAEKLLTLIDWDEIENIDDVIPESVFPEVGDEQEEKVLDVEEIKRMFTDAIADLGLEGWKSEIDSEGKRSNFSASQKDKVAHIPSDEKLGKRASSMTETKVKALIAHELGTHALRRQNGEHTKLKLLGLGLDRYLKGEEGVSTYEQQKIEGSNDYAGFNGHEAISLAKGLDGKKRTFSEVCEIFKNQLILVKKDSDTREQVAFEQAYKNCVRIFRGTTCGTPGAVFTKDIVYREGNIGVWNLVNSQSNEEHRFMVGKYDPTNSRHIWILDQLGITEDDLNSLEQPE